MKYNIIWATVRPDLFKISFDEWYDKCVHKEDICLYLAVSFPEHIHILKDYIVAKGIKIGKMIQTPTHIKGVTYPTCALTRYLNVTNCDDNDIVILSSDDFFPPQNWDEIIMKELSEFSGCIIFNDLNKNPIYSVVQIPIMDFITLKHLNNQIYPSAYNHFWSDNELYQNLKAFNKIKDISQTKSDIIFEHRHHTVGKRQIDGHDIEVIKRNGRDGDVYRIRQSMNVFQRTSKMDRLKKRIISFSLYGNNPMYVNGALENVKLQKIYYPGWTCRFYVDDTLDKGIVAQLNYFGCEVVNKGNSDGHLGLYWRMESFFDNDVELTIIRDCDSRLNLKEAYAVNEWIESGKSFHIMRDHPTGHNSEIMVGMCGARNGFIKDFKEKYDKWIQSYQPYTHSFSISRGKHFFGDQIFMNNVVWPEIIDNHMAHDNYYNFSKNARSFKIDIAPLFIGQRFDQNGVPQYE